MPRHKKNRPAKPAAATPPAKSFISYRAPIALALILIVTWLAYLPALNGSMQWDDEAHVTRPELRSTTGLYRIWFEVGATQQYYPLLHSVFWFEHTLWGDAVLGYHLINLVWHTIAVVLVYAILKRLRIPGALLAASIFASHPVMVESVAWISEQKNTLSAVFYLGSLLLYLRFDESRNWREYSFALGLFVLALMTKTVTASLPAALLVIFWWQRGRLSWKGDVLPLVPFFMFGLAGGLVTAMLERNLGGAQGTEFDLSFLARGLLAGRVIWFYLCQLLWPTNLMFFYPRWTVDPSQWWQWLFPILALALTAALWIIRGRNRGPLACWLFFCGTLFPALGFVNVYPFRYSYVADHFQYLASLGAIVCIATATVTIFSRLPQLQRRLGVPFRFLLLATLAVLSWRQAGTYANSIVLNRATIDRNPDSWIAHTNLAIALSDQGEQQEALEHLQTARRLVPNSVEVHTTLASVLIKAGRPAEAIDVAKAGLNVNPDFPNAYQNLGVAFIRLGKYAEAIDSLQRALQIRPAFAAARANLGIALADTGQTQQAIEEYSRSLQDNPGQPDTLNNLGLLLATNNRAEEATQIFQMAIELQPTRAEFRNNLGSALAQAGSREQAIEQYRLALQLDPRYIQAGFNLATTLAETGRREDAINVAQHALEIATAEHDTAATQQIDGWLKKYQAQTPPPSTK
jgi:tetratricopeptide (TPR) repeat protein